MNILDENILNDQFVGRTKRSVSAFNQQLSDTLTLSPTYKLQTVY